VGGGAAGVRWWLAVAARPWAGPGGLAVGALGSSEAGALLGLTWR